MFTLASNKEQAPDENLNSEQIEPSMVEKAIEVAHNEKDTHKKVKEEMRKNGKRIIAAIVSHLKAVKRTDSDNDDKKES